MKALKPVKDEPLASVKEARYSVYFIYFINTASTPAACGIKL